jgi:broad specificity phosphatase PhoE
MEEQRDSPRIRTILVFGMLFAVFGAGYHFAYFATFSRPLTTVILVRHAEKKIEPVNPDPDLTPEGVERAQQIAKMFADAGINVIYATQYKRTTQTVQPLADRTGVPVTLLNANQTQELVNQDTHHPSWEDDLHRRP